MEQKPSKRLFFLFCLICLALSGCPLPPTSEAYPFSISSQQITLEWNSPPQFPSASLMVSSYRIYFRPHGSRSWQFVKAVSSAGSPRVELNHSDFGNGSFDFAVSAVNGKGVESEYHTSLDASADPYGGWFLNWTVR